MPDKPEVLIATLGTEAQVVTLSLLELARLGYAVQEVVIVRTSGSTATIREALDRLDEAFDSDPRLRRYTYRHALLQGERGAINDITTAGDAEGTFNSIYQLVRRYKLDGYRIHLNVAGGRKPMSIYGMVTAQILFDEADRLWHLVSGEALVKSRRLFPEPGDAFSLVPIPVIRPTDLPPGQSRVIQAATPHDAIREQEQLRQDQRLELFLSSQLTRSERAVIEGLARGLSNREIASRRNVKLNTVEKQINRIYSKWRTFKGLADNSQPRSQIIAELSTYLARQSDRL